MFCGLGTDNIAIYRELQLSYWVYAEESVCIVSNFMEISL